MSQPTTSPSSSGHLSLILLWVDSFSPPKSFCCSSSYFINIFSPLRCVTTLAHTRWNLSRVLPPQAWSTPSLLSATPESLLPSTWTSDFSRWHHHFSNCIGKTGTFIDCQGIQSANCSESVIFMLTSLLCLQVCCVCLLHVSRLATQWLQSLVWTHRWSYSLNGCSGSLMAPWALDRRVTLHSPRVRTKPIKSMFVDVMYWLAFWDPLYHTDISAALAYFLKIIVNCKLFYWTLSSHLQNKAICKVFEKFSKLLKNVESCC